MRVGITAKSADKNLNTVFNSLNRFSVHGAGCIEEKIYREFSHDGLFVIRYYSFYGFTEIPIRVGISYGRKFPFATTAI